MGFDLKSDTGDECQWTGVYWRLMLPTAEHYGWQPKGTKPPEDISTKEWSGTYYTNDGQLVEESDATALAKHLREAAKAEDLEEVSNAIYTEQMIEVHKDAQKILSQLGLTEKPKGLFSRIKQTLLGKKDESIMEIDPPKIARIPVAEIENALNELAFFCDKGAFRIW